MRMGGRVRLQLSPCSNAAHVNFAPAQASCPQGEDSQQPERPSPVRVNPADSRAFSPEIARLPRARRRRLSDPPRPPQPSANARNSASRELRCGGAIAPIHPETTGRASTVRARAPKGEERREKREENRREEAKKTEERILWSLEVASLTILAFLTGLLCPNTSTVWALVRVFLVREE